MTTTDKPFKVLIPAAGTGSRLGDLTKYLNKALIDVSGKPAISRIIDMFPQNAEFVVALGYKEELLKQFLALAYPERKFYFTQVEKYEGENSGLGLTILSAEQLLQEPFIFCACDTIADEKIPEPDTNLVFYSEKPDKKQYRTIDFKDNKVIAILEKEEATLNSMPYIGLCCIKDWQIFWEEMHKGGKSAINKGESFALNKLAEKGILYAKEVNWFDTGSIEELKKTRQYFKKSDEPNILPKPNEAIWFVDDKVIKYSYDKKFIRERVERTKYLKDFVPEIYAYTDNMYTYKKIDGIVLSKIKDIILFKKLLNFSLDFWQKKQPDKQEQNKFNLICNDFYYKKTISRINLYNNTFGNKDNVEIINAKEYPKLSDILNKVDWENICSGLMGRFHGDFHFENILYNEKNDKFIFLDWRQNFGGLKEYGDIYYDLAKLLHGLIICHELIAENKYEVNIDNNVINYSFDRKPILIECEKYYYDWLKNSGYNTEKVKILTALIYLNIAALHHFPYCHLLYYLGKTMLYENV